MYLQYSMELGMYQHSTLMVAGRLIVVKLWTQKFGQEQDFGVEKVECAG